MRILSFVLLLMLFVITSCGYKIQSMHNNPITINVPYVKGDKDGRLTKYLVQALSESGFVVSESASSQYSLIVEIKKKSTTQIGYRYRNKNHDSGILKRLVPDEGRYSLSLVLWLEETSFSKKIIEPYEIEANVDYDFVNPDSFSDVAFFANGERKTVLDFSMGQLDSQEGASLAAINPCYQVLAKKATAYIQKQLVFSLK